MIIIKDGWMLPLLQHHNVITASICDPQNLGTKRNNNFKWICRLIWIFRIRSWKSLEDNFVGNSFWALVPPKKDAWIKSYDILFKAKDQNINLLERSIATIEQYLPFDHDKVIYFRRCITIIRILLNFMLACWRNLFSVAQKSQIDR